MGVSRGSWGGVSPLLSNKLLEKVAHGLKPENCIVGKALQGISRWGGKKEGHAADGGRWLLVIGERRGGAGGGADSTETHPALITRLIIGPRKWQLVCFWVAKEYICTCARVQERSGVNSAEQ